MNQTPKMPRDRVCADNVTFYVADKSDEVTPSTMEDLQEIIEECRKKQRTIYPISTGYNWGLGSKIPVTEGALIVNLCQMTRIVEFDAEKGVVVIEPGVTQAQLSQYLRKRKANYFLDVTGSSEETSIVGNALERGVSYNALRIENVMGLEVLTGRGECIRTGSWRFHHSKTKYSYKYGVGADLTGLFFQSNFGVVTKMVYKLTPLQKHYYSVKLSFNSLDDVAASLANYTQLCSEGVIQSIFHIANFERAKDAVIPNIRKVLRDNGCRSDINDATLILDKFLTCPWGALGVVSGQTKAEVRLKLRRLKKALAVFAKIETFNVQTIERATKLFSVCRKLKIFNLLQGTKPFRYLYFGQATNAALGSVLDCALFFEEPALANFVDQADKGFVYCLPLTDCVQKNCKNMVAIIDETAKSFGFDPAITLNPLIPHVLEAVVSLSFFKSESDNAHKCIRVMQQRLMAAGHIPYRTNIKDMDLYFSDAIYVRYLEQIKNVFDPAHIIAPGRYLPDVGKSDSVLLS